MARYLLSVRIYNTLVGRGYKLVCRRQRCNLPLEKMTPEKRMEKETVKEYEARQLESTVESKPSKYHHWECDKCGERIGYKPKSVRVCVWGATEVGVIVASLQDRWGGGMGIAEFWRVLIYYPSHQYFCIIFYIYILNV